MAFQPPAIRDDASIVAACKVLMALYPRSRYATEGEPTPAEAREAVAAARHIRGVLLPWLSV